MLISLSWEELSEDESARVRRYFPVSPCNDLVRFLPSKFVMTRPFIDLIDRIAQMEVREDDIWVVTYPKCGTTWTQEMVWQIVNNVDMEGGKVPLFGRSPFIEFGTILPKDGSPPPFPEGTPQEVTRGRYVVFFSLE